MRAAATGSRAVLWALCLGIGLLLLSSLFRQPLTLLQAAILVAFAGLSVVRPVDALLIFAAFGPFVGIVDALFRIGFGGRLLETLVLLLLIPWIAIQVRWIRSARWRALDWALLAFGAVVFASLLAHLPVVLMRSGVDSFPRAVWGFFTRTYLEYPAGFGVITQAVLLLEGVGLCVLVSRHAVDVASARRIAGMVIAGATGAAMMNVNRLVEVALRRGSITETLGATLGSLRVNTQFGDLNAAGSYFAMAFVAAVGMSDFQTRRGIAYALAAVPLGLAVWLSGSRAALTAAAIGALGVLIARRPERAWRVIRSRTGLFAATALVLATTAAAVALYPSTRNVGMRFSVWARAELAVTAVRMLGERPLFGVGVSRFYELFPEYASPELRQKFFEAALTPVTHENAHNNFLQILAELGVVGFAAFLLVLVLALKPGTEDTEGVRRAFIAAVWAFLFTALFGHPLLTRVVAFPFWMALGLAAAHAVDLGVRRSAALRLATSCLLVVLVAIVPVRASYEQREANLDGVAIGLSPWQRDDAGNRFRWAGARATLFVAARSRVVRLPLRTLSRTCTVDIHLNGQAADRVTIPSDFWQEVRLRLPAATDGRRSHRVDLIAGDDCAAQGTDRRVLKVGRLEELGVVASGPALP